MSKIKYILFDAANTLIHKPILWEKIDAVLIENGFNISKDILKKTHKIISEIINFPDRTDEIFYRNFNSKLLFSLGIIPTEKLLNELFKSCTYLPWCAFDDTKALTEIELEMGVISNFNKSLTTTLNDLIPIQFSNIIISENYTVRKPNPEFYKLGLKEIKFLPSEILYIGDSLELDIYPVQSLGVHRCLIDRDANFPIYKNRIVSFFEITNFIKNIEND